MLKKTFWMLALALPLSMTAACEMVMDDVRDKIEDGALDGVGGKPGDGVKPPRLECKPFDKTPAIDCKTPEFLDKDKDGCIDVVVCLDGDTGGGEPPLECKPFDKTPAIDCYTPEFFQDKDGCIYAVVCHDGDTGGGLPPSKCKPIDKDIAKDCKDPLWADYDSDGCIDTFICGDLGGSPIPL